MDARFVSPSGGSCAARWLDCAMICHILAKERYRSDKGPNCAQQDERLGDGCWEIRVRSFGGISLFFLIAWVDERILCAGIIHHILHAKTFKLDDWTDCVFIYMDRCVQWSDHTKLVQHLTCQVGHKGDTLHICMAFGQPTFLCWHCLIGFLAI